MSLASQLDRYLAVRRSLGYDLRTSERVLRRFTGYERINYLMLMMVDPHVHFHVVPRYKGERTFADERYPDAGWPGLPDLKATKPASAELTAALGACWQSQD